MSDARGTMYCHGCGYPEMIPASALYSIWPCPRCQKVHWATWPSHDHPVARCISCGRRAILIEAASPDHTQARCVVCDFTLELPGPVRTETDDAA